MRKGTTMSDEELAEEPRERGHSGAATALERKLTAERAVRGREADDGPITHEGARARLREGYAANDPAELRRERRLQRRMHDDTTGGGGDDA